MGEIRTEWKGTLLLVVVFCTLALVACSSDPEGGGPAGVPQEGDSSLDLVITNGRVIDPLSGTDAIATVAVPCRWSDDAGKT